MPERDPLAIFQLPKMPESARSKPAARRILESHGIVQEITGRSRDMVFMARGNVHNTNAPIESL